MSRIEHYASRAAVWLLMVCASSAVVAQSDLDQAAALEQQLHDGIASELAQRGAHSAALIPLFTELGHLYRQTGLKALAAAAYEEARGVLRANQGLSSLEEAPLLEEIIRIEEDLGVREPWRRERDLLALADAHADDLRAAKIYREMGDKRLAMLNRFLAGEFEPQLIAGCYYHRLPSGELPPGQEDHCLGGSRSTLIRAVTGEAWRYYSAAIKALMEHQQYSSAELHDLEKQLVSGAYELRAYGFGRRSLQRLLAYDVANGMPSTTRIDSLLRIADWDIVTTQALHNRVVWDSAVDTYQQAYEKLRDEGVDQESMRALFTPEVPVVLPTFQTNPLASAQTPDTTGHIDVTFEVTKFGRARRVEVLASTVSASREAEKDLIRRISNSVFRPRVVDGRVADAAPVVLRYYVRE